MLSIQSFVFNPFQENTYLLYNEAGEAIIIDPGFNNPSEIQEFTAFIEQEHLSPKLLLNTHCHIDHVLGNRYIYDTYGLMPSFHEGEVPVLLEVDQYAMQMGFHYQAAPIPETFLQAKETITWGADELKCLFVPGHSPGHICFYLASQKLLIAGDTLFQRSIGRTDLPGGKHEVLLQSIKEQLYTLPDEVIVYPGHGSATTIGAEKQHNPYIRG